MGIFVKQFVFAALIVGTMLFIYFGAYLPWLKATLYISAINGMSTKVHTMADFKENFDQVLNLPSPVGQEEVVKFLSNEILFIIGEKHQTEDVDRVLVAYIEPYMFQNNVRHMITMGQLYFSLADQFKRPEDFKKAEDYYLKAEVIGPKLPPVLYGLLNIYQAENDVPKFTAMAEKILSLWPNDQKLQSFMTFLKSKSSGTKQ